MSKETAHQFDNSFISGGMRIDPETYTQTPAPDQAPVAGHSSDTTPFDPNGNSFESGDFTIDSDTYTVVRNPQARSSQ